MRGVGGSGGGEYVCEAITGVAHLLSAPGADVSSALNRAGDRGFPEPHQRYHSAMFIKRQTGVVFSQGGPAYGGQYLSAWVVFCPLPHVNSKRQTRVVFSSSCSACQGRHAPARAVFSSLPHVHSQQPT